MNQTVSINLGGLLFQLNEEAYQTLNNWIEAVEQQFARDKGREEIMADIESRMAELIDEQIDRGREVVTQPVVMKAIEVMGEPHNFNIDEEAEPETERGGRSYKKASKRLYRDRDDHMLGGVCAGMGAYFHIDPWVFRILFIVFAVFFFSGLLIYLLLWAVVPPAVTTAEKLEMQGEPVNLHNITNMVRDEFVRVRNRMRR